MFPSHHPLPPEVAEILDGVPTPVVEDTRNLWHRLLDGTRVRHRIAELAVGLATELAGRGHADFVTEFAHPLVRSVAGELLGIPPGERDIAYGCAEDVLLLANPVAPLADRVAAAHRHVAAQDYLRELRDRCQTDLSLSQAEFTSVLLWCHGAGIDTTRDAITGTVYSMVAEGLWAKAVADRSLIADAVEETLRRFTDPESSADVAGEDVRDQAAFGHGPHAGAHLARAEARLAVEVLTRRLPDLALADGYEPSYAGGGYFGGLESLAVTWPVR